MLKYIYGKNYEIVSVSNSSDTITIGDKIDFYNSPIKENSIVSGVVVSIIYPTFVNYENAAVINIERDGKRYRKYISSNPYEINELIVPVKGKLVAELI